MRRWASCVIKTLSFTFHACFCARVFLSSLSFPSYVFPWSKKSIFEGHRITEQGRGQRWDNTVREVTAQYSIKYRRCRDMFFYYAIMEKRVSVGRSKGSGYEKRSNGSNVGSDCTAAQSAYISQYICFTCLQYRNITNFDITYDSWFL